MAVELPSATPRGTVRYLSDHGNEAKVSASKEAVAEGPDFETALEELEALVERMEGGSLSLDESLAAFERGIHLTRQCQQALNEAEQRVQILIEKDDGSLTTEAAPKASEPSS